MIADQNERGRLRQMFAADYLDSFREPEDAPNPPPPEVASNSSNQSAFTIYRAMPLGFRKAEIAGRFVLPFVHR